MMPVAFKETTVKTDLHHAPHNDDDLGLIEAAVYARRAVGTIQRWISSGRLPAKREGMSRRVLIRRADLEDLLKPVPVAVPRSVPAPAAG